MLMSRSGLKSRISSSDHVVRRKSDRCFMPASLELQSHERRQKRSVLQLCITSFEHHLKGAPRPHIDTPTLRPQSSISNAVTISRGELHIHMAFDASNEHTRALIKTLAAQDHLLGEKALAADARTMLTLMQTFLATLSKLSPRSKARNS